MNQERFDDLTRALATTPLSRWQVLKGLLAGAVVGTSSSLFAVENAEAKPRDCLPGGAKIDCGGDAGLCCSGASGVTQNGTGCRCQAQCSNPCQVAGIKGPND